MYSKFLNITLFFISVLKLTNGFDSNNTFENYINYYNLYIIESEYEYKKNLYEKEQYRIIQHNKANKSWKETLNQMSILTKEEKRKYYGYSKSIARSYFSLYSNTVYTNISIIPIEMDWRNKGVVTAVKSQGSCGSCWAFASTAVIESHVAIQSGKLFDLSIQQVATCTQNPFQCGGQGNCNGATSELAFDYVASSAGLFDEFQLPYTEYYGQESKCVLPNTLPKAKISSYIKLEENNYFQLLNTVATIGPIAVSVDASNWHSYSSGIFDGCDQLNPDINHAVVLMGYGTDHETNQDYWLVRNSWSASWGEAGYIKLKRNSAQDENKLCGLDKTPQDGSACMGQIEPVNVCGTCGILYDSSYPIGVTII